MIIWDLLRATGIVAFLLLWVTTTIGAAGAARLVRHLELHRQASTVALTLTALHAVLLVADPRAGDAPNLVLVAGIGAAGAMVTAALAFTWRRRLGPGAWRAAHVVAYASFIAAWAHGALGTTATTTPGRLVLLASAGTVLFAGAWRGWLAAHAAITTPPLPSAASPSP